MSWLDSLIYQADQVAGDAIAAGSWGTGQAGSTMDDGTDPATNPFLMAVAAGESDDPAGYFAENWFPPADDPVALMDLAMDASAEATALGFAASGTQSGNASSPPQQQAAGAKPLVQYVPPPTWQTSRPFPWLAVIALAACGWGIYHVMKG